MNLQRNALRLAAGLLAGLAASAPALAQDGLYAGAAAGFGRPAAIADNKSGFVPALSLGYAFDNGLRPELELSYRYNSDQGASEHGSSAMANLWYDFWHQGYYFYLGGGVGATRLTVGGDGLGYVSDTRPSWQGGAGFGHAIGRHLSLGLDYRHLASFDSPNYDINGQSTRAPHYITNAGMVELRYSFGHGESHAVATSTEPATRVVPVQ